MDVGFEHTAGTQRFAIVDALLAPVQRARQGTPDKDHQAPVGSDQEHTFVIDCYWPSGSSQQISRVAVRLSNDLEVTTYGVAF